MTPEERLEKKRKNCDMILTALLGESLVKAWWNSRNLSFDMLTPEEVWSTDSDKVYKYLLDQISR